MPATELRHGWGGDRTARDRALRERREARQEESTHPHADVKFGDGHLSPEEIEAALQDLTQSGS
jgi:hypothetical protein